MTKNKGKGGKNRRKGKNDSVGFKRELVFKEFGQEYAQVLKMLGSGRLDVQCFDGVKRIAHIRGNMRKKVWINAGDIILVSIRDFQPDKADVTLKYTSDEARSLKSHGELPDSGLIFSQINAPLPPRLAMINENDENQGNDDILFELDEEDIDDI